MCGHRVTTRSPLQVRQQGEHRWTVDGTPADCVRIALYGLKLQPDWVISGVNHGGNLGQDAVISGTVAAAREAAYHGLRSAAFSHYMVQGVAFDWQRITAWCAEMLAAMLAPADSLPVQQSLAAGSYWNVNFPHLAPGPLALPPVATCQPARSPLNVSFTQQGESFQYDASYAARPQDPGSDVQACFTGQVAVTLLSI